MNKKDCSLYRGLSVFSSTSSLVQNIFFLKKGWKAIFLFSCIDQYVHCKWDKDTDQMVWWPPYLQECNRKLYLIFEIAQKFLISGLCHYYYSYLNPNVFVVVLSWSFKMLLFSEVIFLMANFIFFLEKKYLFCFFEENFLKKKIIIILSLLRIPFF